MIALLSVWLWSSRRETADVKEAAREYVQARTVYDTAKAERLPAVIKYRTLRDSLTLTDTVEVVRVLAAADTVIARDSVALAAADTALARADDLIAALRKANRPKRIQPYVEVTHNPYSKEYAGRLGVEVRTIKNLSLIGATEIRKDGTGFAVGIRYEF